jgi:hypothetical protein
LIFLIKIQREKIDITSIPSPATPHLTPRSSQRIKTEYQRVSGNNHTTQQQQQTTTQQQMSNTNVEEQAILVAVQELISEHNKKIEKTIAKLNNDLLLKIGNLMNPTLTVPKSTRTRTITPVSEDEKCTTVLVSGKNKGGRCSKKATNGSLCTMHHKKTEPIHSTLSEEFVQSDDDVSNTPRVSVIIQA